jgi:hypothetical protein
MFERERERERGVRYSSGKQQITCTNEPACVCSLAEEREREEREREKGATYDLLNRQIRE